MNKDFEKHKKPGIKHFQQYHHYMITPYNWQNQRSKALGFRAEYLRWRGYKPVYLIGKYHRNYMIIISIRKY